MYMYIVQSLSWLMWWDKSQPSNNFTRAPTEGPLDLEQNTKDSMERLDS